MEPDELTCQELVQLVTDYLEATLRPVERARFEAHLANCDGCPVYLEQLRLTIHALGTLTEERIAPAAREELLRCFREWRRA